MINEICTVCSKKHDVLLPQWWNLTDYHGVNGIYCPACFEKVLHKDGKPVHPIAYRNLLARSKTEYKRLVAQGANVLPPPPIDRGEKK